MTHWSFKRQSLMLAISSAMVMPAWAQTETPPQNPTRTILEMQLSATGPVAPTGAAEATEVYRHYLGEIGKPSQRSQSQSAASSNVNASASPPSGVPGN